MITERTRRNGHRHEIEFPVNGTRPAVREAAHDRDPDPSPVVFYLGERIYFRPIELEDEPLLRRWVNDPRIWRYTLHRPPINAGREREWIENLGKSRTEYVFGIVAKDGDRLIGCTGLSEVDPIARSATFGIVIGDVAFQNRGYGTEATRLALRYGFQELNLNRIQLAVFSDNWRAIRVYQKVGFVHEGCLRQAQFRNGTYQDEYRFAILREEWNRLHQVSMPDSRYFARLRS